MIYSSLSRSPDLRLDDQNLSSHPCAENGNAGRDRRLKHAVTGLIIGDVREDCPGRNPR